MTTTAKRLKDLDRTLTQQKHQLIARSMLALTAIIVLGFAHSFSTAWLHVDSAHLAVALLAVTGWLFREKMSLQTLTAGLLLLACSYSASSLLSFGLASAGLPLFVATAIVCVLIFGNHVTLVVCVLAILSFIFAGFFQYHQPIPASADMSPSIAYINWAAITIASLLFIPLLADYLTAAKHSYEDQIARANQSHPAPESSQYDPLTGLPVLQVTLDRLRHELDRGKRHTKIGAVMMIDVDDFAAINQQYGSDGGDRVLRALASRISSIVRAADTVSRIGGDEFVAIFADQADEDQVRLIARKILATVNNPIAYSDEFIQLKVSIGISLFPTHSTTPQELLALADNALEIVKTAGGDNFRITSTEL